VIDAVDLVLVDDLSEVLVKFTGRLEITTEGFFDYETPPVTILFVS